MGKSHFVSQYRIYVHRTEEPTMSSDKNLIIESTAEENQIGKFRRKVGWKNLVKISRFRNFISKGFTSFEY